MKAGVMNALYRPCVSSLACSVVNGHFMTYLLKTKDKQVMSRLGVPDARPARFRLAGSVAARFRLADLGFAYGMGGYFLFPLPPLYKIPTQIAKTTNQGRAGDE